VDFLLVLIELFLLGIKAEALPAKINRKSAHCKGVGQQPLNFHVEGDAGRACCQQPTAGKTSWDMV